MRTLFFAGLLLVLASTNAQAQHIHVKLTTGTTESFPIEEISGITYSDGTMHLHRYDGNDLSWSISEVEHYHWYEPVSGFDDAIRLIESVHILKVPDPEAGPVDFTALNEAIAELDARDYAQAEAILDTYIEAYPYDEYALLLRGNARRFAGKHEAAIEDYDAALALNPVYFNAFFNRGLSHHALGRIAEALADFSRAIEADPNNPRGYHERGFVNQAEGRYGDAMRDYDRTIELDPANAYVHVNRGILRLDRRDPRGAIADYHTALEIDPEHVWAWNNLGSVVMGLANKSQEYALEILVEYFDFDREIELIPDAHNVVGNPELHHAVHDVAIEHFDRAIAVNPTYATAYGNKALSLLYKRSVDEACELWRTAAELGDESAPGYLRSICE